MNLNSKMYKNLLLTSCLIFFVSLLFPQISTDFTYQEASTASNEIPIMKSFLKSAIIPGWGELSVGNKSGYFFLASEILMWGSRLYFLEEVNLREEESYLYALQHGGLQPGKHDRAYLELLTRYNSSGFEPGGYNEMILKRAQSLYPNDQEAQNQYLLNNAILDESLFWSWDSREDRRQYSIMRKNADHNRDYAKTVIGVIVANHVISAINAARVTSIKNRRSRIQFGFDYDRKHLAPIVRAEISF